MNLLDKLTYSIKSGLALLLIPIFFACEDPSQLGLEMDGSNAEIKGFKEVFDLSLSTIYVDSLRSDGSQYCLFGQYQDSVVGNIKAIGYAQHLASGTGILPRGTGKADTIDTLAFSRAFLELRISDLRAIKQMSNELIEIFEIKDTLFAQPIYLSNREQDLEALPIGSISFDFDNLTDSIISLQLSDAYGQKIFNLISNSLKSDDSYDSLISHQYHIAPLAFVPGVNNTTMYSFDLIDPRSAVYLEMKSNKDSLYYYNFLFSGYNSSGTRVTSPHYTYIDRDFTNSRFNDLGEDYKESGISHPTSFLDMIAGVHPKIDLTTYIDFVKNTENFTVHNATLSLGAYTKLIDKNLRTVPSVNGYFLNANNKISGSSFLTGVSFGNALNIALLNENAYLRSQSEILSIPYSYYDNTYSADLTLFTQLIAEQFKNDGEILTDEIVLFGTRTNSLDLGQAEFINQQAKLTIYYSSKVK